MTEIKPASRKRSASLNLQPNWKSAFVMWQKVAGNEPCLRRKAGRSLSYTNVGNISRIEGTANKAAPASANQEIAADEPSKEPPAKRFHRSHVQRLDIDKCIICQVEKCKRGKGARSREALTQNISEYGSASLLRAAEIMGDNRVQPQIKG